MNEVIQYIATNPDFRLMVENITKGHELTDDLFQELVLILMEMDEDKLVGIYQRNELKWWCVRILMNQWYSKTSPFWKKYKQHGNTIDQNADVTSLDVPEEQPIDLEVIIDQVNSALNGMHWYNKELLMTYLREGSYMEVHRKTGIHYKSIRNTVRETIDKVKSQVKWNKN